MRALLTVILYLGLSFSFVYAQVSILLEWSQDSIAIGEEAELILSAQLDDRVEILAIPTFFVDTIYSTLQSFMQATDTANVAPVRGDYDILSANGWKDKNSDGLYDLNEMTWSESILAGKRHLEHRFKLRLWDPGQMIAIYPPILYTIDGNQQQYNTPPPNQAIIKVTAPPGVAISQDSLEMAPIRNIYEEESNFSDYLIYIIGIGALGLLGIAIWYYKKRQALGSDTLVIDAPAEVLVPAHIKALAALDNLKNKELWQQGQIKEYQSELTFILRSYLEDRFEIDALEKTTREIKLDLKDANLTSDQISLMSNVLQVADLVKFAKAIPGVELHSSFMQDALRFVNETKLEKEEGVV
jgi:hypothetical protein